MDELNIISSIFSKITEPNFLKNDAFVLGEFVITKDILVEGIHFFSESTAKKLAKKSLRVNLSDIASMGATPIGYFLGIALNDRTKKESWLAEFANGLLEDQEKYNIKLFGGDTVVHSGSLTISITMIGRHSGIVLCRSGAKEGDYIALSGFIGDSYLGLLSYQNKIEENIYFRQKYDLPEPKVELGKQIIEFATSCIDVSDGLLHDANHIAKNSNITMEIEIEKVPISNQAKKLVLQNPELKKQMITAGDDYELLFTIPQNLKSFLDNTVHIIGKVKSGCGVNVIDKNKEKINFQKLGFVHK